MAFDDEGRLKDPAQAAIEAIAARLVDRCAATQTEILRQVMARRVRCARRRTIAGPQAG
jgi:hypothetical protein